MASGDIKLAELGSSPLAIAASQGVDLQLFLIAQGIGPAESLIVRDGADVDAALEGVVGAIYENAGQICSAGSRLVIERPLHQEFVARLAERARAMSLGHGLDRPEMGPVNSAAHLQKIAGYVDGARARGIAVAAGGDRTADPRTGEGWFFQPTILDSVPRTIRWCRRKSSALSCAYRW